MKKLNFIIIALLCSNFLYSQWAPHGAKWYYNHISGSSEYLSIIESVGDTLILNKNCKKLINYTIYVQNHPNGSSTWDTAYCLPQFIYDDSNRVFMYDSLQHSFFMLYDFNASAGDTITVRDSLFYGHCDNSFTFDLFQYRINSVNDTLINGTNLKVQNVTTTQNSGWFISDPYNPQGYYPIILEKIGSFKFLFGDAWFVEGSVSYLRCYEDSSLVYHAPDWPSSLACDYLYTLPTTVNYDKNLNNKIEIIPNPLTEQSFINFPAHLLPEKTCLEIYDLYGRLVKIITAPNSKQQCIKREVFAVPGLYIVWLKSENYQKAIKLLVQ